MSRLINESHLKNEGKKGVPHSVSGKNIPFRGSWAAFKPVIDKNKCIKCHMCWVLCPDTAIKINKDGTTRSDYTICKGCGVCAEYCPAKCIEMKRVKAWR